MPLVTKIERQKNRVDRYSVFLDGEFAFGLSDLDLSLSGLREGHDLSPAEAEKWSKTSQQSKAYERALHYLSFRPRSRREVSDYLSKKGYEETDVGFVIERLGRSGLVNDEQFAASWVSNRQILKPRSKRRLVQELRQKGVSEDEIESSLVEIDSSSELENIKQIAIKKQALVRYQDTKKLMSYLCGQGFPYDLVKQALSELSDAN